MKSRQSNVPAIAAAKAGFSTATAYRIEADPRLPPRRRSLVDAVVPTRLPGYGTARSCQCWRPPPASARWPSSRRFAVDISGSPRECAGPWSRIAGWRALNGPDRDVIFRQEHPPGRMSLSDFTDLGALGITIASERFDHRLYHFRLAFSGFEPCPCCPRRREFCGARGRPAGRAVGAGRRTGATPQRQPVGGVLQPRSGGTGGHLYDDRLECFLGSTQLLTLRRGRPPQGSGKHGHVAAARPNMIATLNSFRDTLSVTDQAIRQHGRHSMRQ
jgi:hypothetical protein